MQEILVDAVSSFFSTLLRASMTFLSPFIVAAP
jgi:hypothetical protein